MRVSCTITALVSALALGACEDTLPPEGQVVLHLDTDAPVAPSGDLAEPVALFDRVLVEIFPPGEDEPCGGCTRELPLDASLMRRSRFSFGFLPRPREQGFRARLRMFRSAGRATPRPESTIELVGYLPAVGEDGITVLTATFRADDVGRPRGTLAQPIVFDRGAPSPSLEGTWPGARVEPCAGEPPPGAVCVPGGAFFMGDPRVTVDRGSVSGAKEHLVALSPYFLDAHEVTVGELRASGLAERDSRGRLVDPVDDWNDELAGKCVYTSEPGAYEDRPVTCVSWALAAKLCAARGGALPTEAELEYVASRRGTRLAPWGDRDPACGEAVVSPCASEDAPAIGARTLPSRAGSGALDRIAMAGGEIVDLGANVREWTRDAFARDDEPCWSAALLVDPSCVAPARAERSTKGGDFAAVPVDYAQARRATDASFKLETVGFRCAYPGRR